MSRRVGLSIGVTCVVGLLLVFAPLRTPATAAPAPAGGWEYAAFDGMWAAPDGRLLTKAAAFKEFGGKDHKGITSIELANAAGAQGWELTAATHFGDTTTLWFKRQRH